MSADLMQYDQLVERALRGVVKSSLYRVAERGLPGSHHFYITFRTDHPETDIAEYLVEKYPEEMTIVLQHQFYGLEVDDSCFRVTLSFNSTPELLSIPFAAITIFADPSVNFVLQFKSMDKTARIGDPAPTPLEIVGDPLAADEAGEERKGEVVSLDSFRRK